jgi:translation initiation factor 1A
VAHFGNRYILPYDKHSTPAIQKKPRTGDGVLTDFTEEKNETGEIIRVRLPKKGNREMFGCAELMMGANHIRVRCFDGVTRLGRIKGKIKKKVWIHEGDILIVIPWNFQDEKCDIIYRYTGPQVEWLRRNNYL